MNYQILNLPTRLLNSKMQTMMTYNPKYDNQVFRAEIEEHTSLGRCRAKTF